MSVYSTACHNIKFIINTVDEDGFIKSISGENFVKVDAIDIEGQRHAQDEAQDLYLRKVLQTCEYCKHDSEAFSAVVTWEYNDHLGNTYESGKFTI